jgi:hypothetical protein
MAITVDIQLTKEGMEALEQLKKMLVPDEIKLAILKFFDRFAPRIAGYITSHLLSGTPVHRRTGNLARSITGRGVNVNGIPAVRVGIFRGPALKYAGPIDQGTKPYNPSSPYDTIRPVNAKSLAMPVNDSLTPAGVARYQGPRQYPGTLKFIPFRSGGNVIGGLFDARNLKSARDEHGHLDFYKARAAYLLLTKLDLKPTFFLRTGMLAMLPNLAEALSRFLVGYLHAESGVSIAE